MKDLKKIVNEIEAILLKQSSCIDARAREGLNSRIEDLKREIDEADAAELIRRNGEALEILATLLSLITNVMTLWK